MKIVQIPFGFYPDAVGGTEVYVAELARVLTMEHRCDVLIAAPGPRSEEYGHKDLRVRRFAVSPQVADVAELYGDGDDLAAEEFDKILTEEKPDLVHLHAFTRGVSLKIVRKVKARGIPVIFTYHTPTVTCTRGTMMRWGRIPCDGEMLGRRCTACTLHGHSLKRVTAFGLASLAKPIQGLLRKSRRTGRVWTAFRMRGLIELRHGSTRSLLSEVDHIVAVCEWVHGVLLQNGVAANKITLCRQGICPNKEFQARTLAGMNHRDTFTTQRPLRLAFFGRLDRTKGLDILLCALHREPELPISLDVFAIVTESTGKYETQVRELANERRVALRPPIGPEEVIETMSRYDAIAVPSQGLETGPLVALEAFAAGVPVIGSRLGGIAELVQHEVNGLLVAPEQIDSWRAVLVRLCQEKGVLDRLRRAIQPPRQMEEVGREMSLLYRQTLKTKNRSVVPFMRGPK